MNTNIVGRCINWFINLTFSPVWVKPLLGSVDDGFVSWLVTASGDDILDVRYMSESKRFWQYGSMFEFRA